jgi:hypothetical protein
MEKTLSPDKGRREEDLDTFICWRGTIVTMHWADTFFNAIAIQ